MNSRTTLYIGLCWYTIDRRLLWNKWLRPQSEVYVSSSLTHTTLDSDLTYVHLAKVPQNSSVIESGVNCKRKFAEFRLSKVWQLSTYGCDVLRQCVTNPQWTEYTEYLVNDGQYLILFAVLSVVFDHIVALSVIADMCQCIIDQF